MPKLVEFDKVIQCQDCAYSKAVTCLITGAKALFCEHDAQPVAVEPTHFCSYGVERKKQ